MSDTTPSKTVHRLMLSGAVMFLCDLVFALPPLYFATDLFPGTRWMYTAHMEGIQNAFMLFSIAFLVPYLSLGARSRGVMEVGAHVGAWLNFLPWFYAAYTGVHLNYPARAVGEAWNELPANNETYSAIVQGLLTTCGIGDLIAWGLIVWGLRSRLPGR